MKNDKQSDFLNMLQVRDLAKYHINHLFTEELIEITEIILKLVYGKENVDMKNIGDGMVRITIPKETEIIREMITLRYEEYYAARKKENCQKQSTRESNE